MDDKRTTSAAKDVELESYKRGALDEQEQLSDTFRVPAIRDYYEPNYNTNDNATDSGQGAAASVPDHAPRSEPELRPNDEFARGVDRETFESRQQALQDEYAKEMAAAYREEFGNDQSQSHDRDRGYGM